MVLVYPHQKGEDLGIEKSLGGVRSPLNLARLYALDSGPRWAALYRVIRAGKSGEISL